MFEMIGDNFVTILVLLVVMWVAQFGGAYWQMRRFYSRMTTLRRDGLTAVGLAGNKYKGRIYAVVVIDNQNKIVHAEGMQGWTIFAGLKPLPQIVGMSVEDVLAQENDLPVPTKLQSAVGNAARDLAKARRGEHAITAVVTA